MGVYFGENDHQHRLGALERAQAFQRAIFTLTSTDEIETALRSFVKIVAETLRAQQVTLITFDLARRRVETVVRSNPISDEGSISLETLDDASAFLALHALGVSLAHHQRESTLWPASPKEPLPWTTVSVPIVYGERILGLIKANNPPEASPFTKEDEELLTSFAGLAALALEGFRLRRAEMKQRRQAETLREVARILNYSFDQQQLLSLILDQLSRVVEYNSAAIMTVENDRFAIVAHRRMRSAEQVAFSGRLEDFPHLAEVVRTKKPLIIEDTFADSRWQVLPHSEYIRCWLGVPLVGRDHVLGLLNLDKEQPYYYTDQDAEVALAFANQAAIALENARLYIGERQRGDQLAALRATVADISAELELHRLLEAILKRAVNLLNASGGDLGLYREEQQDIEIVVSHNMGKDYAGVHMAIGEGAMGMAIKTKSPIIIEDYQTWPNASPQYREGPWHAVIATPLIIGQRILGAMGIVAADPARKFTENDQYLLGLFAQHAAIAIENARLYRNAIEAAEGRAVLHRVSQELLSATLPPEEIYEAIYRAASQLMEVEAFVVTRYDLKNNLCEALFLYDRGKRFPARKSPADQGLSGLILKEGRTIYLPDLDPNQAENGFFHFGERERIRCVLAAPMISRGQIIGMMSTQSYRPYAYNREDQTLLEMLAAYAAIALDNAALVQNIQQLAITDPLTGLFNRRHWFDLSTREFRRARRFNRPLVALMIDIDHFKQVNDRYGHATGDRVLGHLGKVIRSSLREVDIVGRYGGEEFIALLPEADLPKGRDVAHRLIEAIRKAFSGGELPRITVSIGVAAIQPSTVDINGLVHQADLAMYKAKSAGGNRVAP